VTSRAAALRRNAVPSKVALAGEILVVYARVRLRMRRGDIREVVASIRSRSASRPTRSEAGSAEVWLTSARLANAVIRTLTVLRTDARCLSQSLVLLWLLARRGIPSTLVVGVHTSPEFAAHAWIEHAGKPLLSPGSFPDGRLLEL
jgi:transglutaminase superfamily protein